MSEKKNSSARTALDDNNLENVSGGIRYVNSTRHQTDDGKWFVQVDEGELGVPGFFGQGPVDTVHTKTCDTEQEALDFIKSIRGR